VGEETTPGNGTRPTGTGLPAQNPDGSFTSAAGDFTVLFPDKPREKLTEPQTKTFSVQKDGGTFAVAVADLPEDVKKQLAGAGLDTRQSIMRAQFDRARDAAIGNGTFLKEQKITPGEFPWLICEFQYETSGFMVGRQRLYLANNRLYAVIALGDQDFVTSDDADKFFASFKLTDREQRTE
jgi:hypothetical protein